MTPDPRPLLSDHRPLTPDHRLCLHAARLAFHHPADGRWMEFDAPPPQDMREILQQVKDIEYGN
jgi:23S rRNA pseudouridine1911/1915/1917 synthase